MTRPWWPTDPSSVATRAPGISAAPSAWAASRKPSSVSARRRARRPRSPAARSRRRRRRGSGGGRRAAARSRGRAGRAGAARRRRRARTAGWCRGRRPRAGSRASPSSRAHDAERARQERALVLSPAPALGRGEHVELAGVGARPVGVGDGEHHVRAVARRPTSTQRRPSAPARAARQRHASLTPTLPQCGVPSLACSSCSDTTAGLAVPRRRRSRGVAAIPPAIVVMHGMPRATAARRIS